MYVEVPCSWVRIVTEETMTISVLAHNFLNGPLTHRKIFRRHVLSEVGIDTSADMEGEREDALRPQSLRKGRREEYIRGLRL